MRITFRDRPVIFVDVEASGLDPDTDCVPACSGLIYVASLTELTPRPDVHCLSAYVGFRYRRWSLTDNGSAGNFEASAAVTQEQISRLGLGSRKRIALLIRVL